MKIGIMSDTHEVGDEIIRRIVQDEFIPRGAEMIFHCGDIEVIHLDAELFGNLPVVCALVEEQADDPKFVFLPTQWKGTISDHRVVNLGSFKAYVGHKRSFDALVGSMDKFNETLDALSKDYDNLRWIVSGHTHHQTGKGGGNVWFINPGGVIRGYNGYEFAFIDTDTDEVTFSRIPKHESTMEPVKIGILSDTGKVSIEYPDFWQDLAQEFKQRDVSVVVIVGNIILDDVGRKEFSDFEKVYYDLPSLERKPKEIPNNWFQIPDNKDDPPIVKIGGYHFFVQHKIGGDIYAKSEYEASQMLRDLQGQYQVIDCILSGLINDALYEEGDHGNIVIPGSAYHSNRFAVLELPKFELTFSQLRS